MHKRLRVRMALAVMCLIAICGGIGIGLYYPLKYAQEIVTYADKHNVDPVLVASIIRAESRFRKDVVSKKGAVGLMQLTPETGQWVAQKLGMDTASLDLTQVATNIELGSWYIGYLLDRYQGNLKSALSAYNAGASHVNAWLKNASYSKDGVNLDAIPFPETEKYHQRVTDFYTVYKLLYSHRLD